MAFHASGVQLRMGRLAGMLSRRAVASSAAPLREVAHGEAGWAGRAQVRLHSQFASPGRKANLFADHASPKTSNSIHRNPTPFQKSLTQRCLCIGGPTAASTSAWTVHLVPCLKDNYAYLIANSASGCAAIVDPSEPGPVEAALNRLGLSLKYILCTHHHWDHTGGNVELKKDTGAKVVGPEADKDRIPGIDVPLKDGQVWDMDGLEVRVLHTPGHTTGHCSFYLPDLESVFTGDTLFSLGCGRLFEGTPAQMWTSLSRLSALPSSTKAFCGHEYTASNAKFALSVEPTNSALQERVEVVKQLRSQDLPTIPTTLELELATNPFLRPHSEEIRRSMKLPDSASDVDVFAAVRRAKDAF